MWNTWIVEHEEESVCPKGPWLGATAEPSWAVLSSLSSWSWQEGGGRSTYEKCSFHFLEVLGGYLIPAPCYGDMNSKKGCRVVYSLFMGPSSVRWILSHSHTLTDIYREQSKKPETANRGQGKRWHPCSAFWDSPSFSQPAVAAGGCHKMCRIALVLCRHCSALTFVSSKSVILWVNLVCKCFPSSTARCICHVSCVTLVPSLKIQSFYSCWYFL